MLPKNYINLTEDQKTKYIYRTVSFSRLVAMFEENQNTLTSPSLWDDPFENFILKAAFNWNGEKVKFPRDMCFGQSWSLKYESDAMWRIYSPDKSCVRIPTTIKQLAESLSSKCKSHQISAFIGKIKYYPEKKMKSEAQTIASDIMNSTGINFAKTLLFKRNSFVHEREVRLIYLSDDDMEKSIDIYKYEIDPHQLITSIAFDPRATDQLVKVYTHYLRQKIGFKSSIIKSKLYKPPKDFIFYLKT